MSRIAIMQPYVFPYIGYFQLINSVELFVFYNDVNFIKKGWINRNKILLEGKDLMFTIPCKQVSQNKRICDTQLAFDDKEKNRFLLTVTQAYKKASQFKTVYPIIERVTLKSHTWIDDLAIESVKEVCLYLELETKFRVSRNQYGNEGLKREERLIDICVKENSLSYINPSGGTELYSKEYFGDRGVELQFLNPTKFSYRQFNNDFVPWLSMIDVLMFNERDKIREYLSNFELL